MSDIGRLISALREIADEWEAPERNPDGLTRDEATQHATQQACGKRLREELADFDD